jgi:Domain of unknown function (DUF397)
MQDSGRRWIKAERSYASSQCVEVAADTDGIYMRNSRVPALTISHTRREFAVFVEAVKNGEFDHLVED